MHQELQTVQGQVVRMERVLRMTEKTNEDLNNRRERDAKEMERLRQCLATLHSRLEERLEKAVIIICI
jgi:hypothetical protein